ncbi:MAG: PLP-dependent aminotransferase family protein [Candidatus Eremiobacteraeota bacterium]|nr:PLP-dependent aminotransferase family protein [Candidatus Eremiobacteraeota bacterium]
MIDLVKNYSTLGRRMKKSVIRELLALTNKPGIISFAGGLPTAAGFPVEELKDITLSVLNEEPEKALQYGETEGYPKLRKQLVEWMKREGLEITEANLLVTVASQQGLDLTMKLFVDPSDPVIVEMPSYVGGLQSLTSYGANMIGVPIDDDGIRIDILEKKLLDLKGEGEHYKLIYVVPDFQNPSGVTLSLERRRRLVEIAQDYQVIVIEDTPYRELRFEGEEHPSLYNLDRSGNVISLHTFSKILVPGLRIGWVVAHEDIIRKIAVAKQSVDLCTPNFTQAIAAEFMRRGLLAPHIEKIKVMYRQKRDVMLKALESYMPQVQGLRWTKPQGGLFLWVSLPEYIDADQMFYEAIEKKVAYVIGSAFHHDGSGKNTFRLNFSFPSEEEIDEGIKRLAEVIKGRLKKESFAVNSSQP